MIPHFTMKRVTIANDEDDLTFLRAVIQGAAEVVLDLETTGLIEYAWTGGPLNGGTAARVVMISLTLPTAQDGTRGPDTFVVPLSHPDSPFSGRWREVLRDICEVIEQSRLPVIGQNIKFDVRWIGAATHVDLSPQVAWDTKISSQLLDENTPTSLKPRASATFSVDRWDDFDLSTPAAAEGVPLFDLAAYAARDTYWTWALAHTHRQRMFLLDQDPEPVGPEEVEDARLGVLATWCAMPSVAALSAIEQRGIQLDLAWTQERLQHHRSEGGRIEATLAERYGELGSEVNFAATSHWFQAWTDAAVEAGDLKVAATTGTGRPQWNKAVLVRQARSGSDVAVDLLALRSHRKKAEYLTSWLLHADRGGTIRANYNAGTVVTGRLSSDSPNMQQVTSELRPAFVPRAGYLFADLDYSQIELRAAAFIARCEPMLEAFRRGDDLHTLLAAKITGKDPAAVLPLERQAAKSANFGLLYGMSPDGFRAYAETVYDIALTREEAQAIHRAFFDTWEGMGAWHSRIITRAQNTGQVSSPIGRVRRLPSILHGSMEALGYAERAAINAPVQGFASDILQIATASIEGTLPGRSAVAGARVVATVHDSILVEVSEDNWQDLVSDCLLSMIDDVAHVLRVHLRCDLDVPLVVASKIGTRWGMSDVWRSDSEAPSNRIGAV